MNVLLMEPPAMVTDAGTCATEVLLLLRDTVAPVGGACPLRVRVPVEEEPPVTLLGFNVSEIRLATVTVSETLRVTTYVPLS